MISLKIRFAKKFISFLTIIGLCIPMLLSICSFAVRADEHKTEQQLREEQYEREEKARYEARVAELKVNFINGLCQSMPSSFNRPFIISPVEWEELDITRLIGIHDMPHTAFGRAGLRWLSLPVADYNEITRRQNIIRTLMQNESSFDQLSIALQNVKKGEDPLIQYCWDGWQSGLHRYIKEMILPDIEKPKELSQFGEMKYELSQKLYGEEVNKLQMSVPGLEATALAQFFNLIGLTFETYIEYCIVQMMWRPTHELKDPKLWARAFVPDTSLGKAILKYIFKGIWQSINPYDDMKVPGKEKTYKVYEQNFKDRVEKSLDNMGPLHKIQILLTGSAKDKYTFGYESAEGLSDTHRKMAGAACAASATLAYYFYYWGYFKVCDIWQEGKKLINQMHLLHVSLVDIAKLMRSLKDLQAYTKNNEALHGSYARAVLNGLLGDNSKASPEFKELMELLHTSTFDNADGFMYSRGRVLRAHVLLQKVKDGEIRWLLQAVAELDGYCTLARLMKAYEHKENKFVFAEFVESDTPHMNIRSCWEPLAPTKNPVVNDIRLGANGKPIRMLITGPNGGGKSTFLKSVGHAVTMAQSWGIVAADKAELTIFNGVRTSLDPKEDLSAGISKFTAQKERISNIGNLMKQTTPNNKMLVILDEPYTGTIDDQMADRVHQFGVQAAQAPHAALCIATHVKKPIELARNGSFANYQIEILEPKLGQFVRTFKIKDGPAHWWFNDKPRVTRFIDALDPARMRKNPGEQVPVAVAQDGKQSGKQVGDRPGVGQKYRAQK